MLSTENQKELKDLLADKNPDLWAKLKSTLSPSLEPSDLLFVNKIRRAAISREMQKPKGTELKVAVVGGYTFFPFSDFIDLHLFANAIDARLFVGEYDNYVSEILGEDSALVKFKPDVVLLFPAEKRHRHEGSILTPAEVQRAAVGHSVDDLIGLCRTLHERTRAEIIVANFRLPFENHFGPIKHKGIFSEWNFRKLFNLELGIKSPTYLHVLDSEFVSCVMGIGQAEDARGWYETKQMGSPHFLAQLASEAARAIAQHRQAAKKVIVLDLDNTLWGGVIGDDDVTGIELGDTSPRGEAFKDFQKFIKQFQARGFLLAVCSKNEDAVAKKPFLEHPEMVLKLDDIVCFKANWKPKADNLNEIAQTLNLGVDSLIFLDDNPAEIANVNQFLPEVSTICLGNDPAHFKRLLNSSGYFEQRLLTNEDLQKTEQYKVEGARNSYRDSVADMPAYLKGLEMVASISPFTSVDAPRISQLIGKSNQFNLTTKRRTEAEVLALMVSPDHRCFTVRLADKFGDYGLIAVIICERADNKLVIDTLLMSCRVLERGVEQEIFNKIHRIAEEEGLNTVHGTYIPTKKNMMVRDLYPRYGFELVDTTDEATLFNSVLNSYKKVPTFIHVKDQA